MTRTRTAAPRRLVEAAARAGGVVGFAATHLVTGEHVAHEEERSFPTASVIKVPVLVALYAEALAGRVDLAERVPLRQADRVAGSGVLQDLDEGLAPTLRDLGRLMITVSDNMATDLVLQRVSPPRVEEVMAELGLTSIQMPMTIREMLFELAGMDADDPRGYAENRRRLRHGETPGGRAIDPSASDRATPADTCRLLELLERRQILDEAACGEIVDILERQKFEAIIPARLPVGTITAHKTGSLRSVRNDAGIVRATSGPYAVAIFSMQLPEPALGVRALADLSLAIYEHFTRG